MPVRNFRNNYDVDFQLLLPAFIVFLIAGIFGICVDSGPIFDGQPIKTAVPLPQPDIDLDHFPYQAPPDGVSFFGEEHG